MYTYINIYIANYHFGTNKAYKQPKSLTINRLSIIYYPASVIRSIKRTPLALHCTLTTSRKGHQSYTTYLTLASQ